MAFLFQAVTFDIDADLYRLLPLLMQYQGHFSPVTKMSARQARILTPYQQ
jgi:hypothetical protein